MKKSGLPSVWFSLRLALRLGQLQWSYGITMRNTSLSLVSLVRMLVPRDTLCGQTFVLQTHCVGRGVQGVSLLARGQQVSLGKATCDACKMETLNAWEAGLKQLQALHSNHTLAFHSDVSERLEHEVTNGHITDKAGRSMHKLRAIAKLESEALSSKFTRVRSQTLCQYVSFLVSSGDKPRRRALVLAR